MTRDHAVVQHQSLRRDVGGAAYVEFLIAFIPVFLMFLGMIQAALLYAANLVVTHAANTAARAAVVVLPDDPSKYDGEAQNSVDFGATSSRDDPLNALLDELHLPVSFTAAGTSGSKRLNAIRAAASIPLLAVSPSYEQLIGDAEVYKAIGGNPAVRAATGAALYNRTAVAVTFPTRPGSTTYRTTFGAHEDITVRVTYLFHCGIPLANRYMCDDYASLATGIPIVQLRELQDTASSARATPEDVRNALSRVRTAQDRLERAQPGRHELNSAQTPWLAYLTILTGARFSILRAESTLRNHGAGYSY